MGFPSPCRGVEGGTIGTFSPASGPAIPAGSEKEASSGTSCHQAPGRSRASQSLKGGLHAPSPVRPLWWEKTGGGVLARSPHPHPLRRSGPELSAEVPANRREGRGRGAATGLRGAFRMSGVGCAGRNLWRCSCLASVTFHFPSSLQLPELVFSPGINSSLK